MIRKNDPTRQSTQERKEALVIDVIVLLFVVVIGLSIYIIFWSG